MRQQEEESNGRRYLKDINRFASRTSREKVKLTEETIYKDSLRSRSYQLPLEVA